MEERTKSALIELLKKMPSLMFGLFLYSTAIMATLYSNLGMSPWDVFHVGLVNHTSLTLGQVNMITGFIILFASYFIGVTLGLGSVFNMIFIGVFIDLIENMKIFRTPDTLIGQIFMLIFGIFLIGWASYFYLRVNLGAGPRDGLMEGLVKKTNKPVWMIRGAIEGTVLIAGYFLRGPIGIGTLITAGCVGFSVQFAFRVGGYSSKDARHSNLVELYRSLRPNTADQSSNEQM
jgi:uncharacterized protein